jgi:hypothetical protein
MLPEVEGVARRLPRVLVRLRLGLVVWHLHKLAAPLALQPLLAQGVVAGAGVVEGLLRARPLQELRLPVAEEEAAVARLRLRPRACWARSSWWPTREGMIRRISPKTNFPKGKIRVNHATLKRDGVSPVPFMGSTSWMIARTAWRCLGTLHGSG